MEVERIWYEITNNLQRYNLSWEWMEKDNNGEYLLYKDVIKLIEKYIDNINCRQGEK